MLNIVDWNINPNQNWYIKLKDSGSDITVDLYTSQSDADAEINVVASGTGAYGSGSEVVLTMDAGGSPTISFFNPALAYHLKVAGAAADPDVIYHLHPFVDLPEINNSVYRSEDLIYRRVINEINTHTHVSKNKTISLATLVDGLAIQDVLEIDSSFRGETTNNLVDEIIISGSQNSLISTIGCVEYIDFVR